jgi:homoserine O-acetyltransferase
MALISYRSYEGYAARQPINTNQHLITAQGEAEGGAASYQRYQGEKLAARFNAFSYYQLSKTMDSHHVGRGRDGVEEALGKITARALVLGIDSDVLFPPSEQQYIAAHIPQAKFALMQSLYGHDGFLLEYPQLITHLQAFFSEIFSHSIINQSTEYAKGNIAWR